MSPESVPRAGEVISLMNGAGITVTPWQRQIIRAWLCDCHEPAVFGHQRGCMPRACTVSP